MAQDIATLGYQEPKFSWQMPCKYVALDVNTPTDTRAGDHPVIHSTIDFRSQIKAAWPVLLDQLQQSGIPIPDIARTPILPGINDTCRNRVRPDGLEVNCFVKPFSWVNDTDDEGNYNGTDLCIFGTGGGYMLKSDLTWDGSGKVATVKNDGAIVYAEHQRWTDTGVRLAAGTIVKGVADTGTATSASVTYLTTPESEVFIVYPLAEPLFIPFEQPVNLSLGELSKYTFIGAHDINDAPMYDLQTHFPYGDATENPDGHHHFLLTRWNAAWLREHNEFPMTAITTFDGIGFVANYDSAFTDHFLLQDVVKQLKDKGIIQ